MKKQVGVENLLLITSFVGSILGFLVCYQTLVNLHQVSRPIRMRVCMLNSMSLAFIFAMFIELPTGSKSLAVIVPVATVCLPIIFMMKPLSVLDIVESGIANLMSVSMSVMLIGMVTPDVIWVIQCILVLTELLLYLAVIRDVHLK
jgi:hypothetical protein